MNYETVLETSDTSLYMVDLPQPLAGFEHFICSWILDDRKSGNISVVDCGPKSSIPILAEAMEELEIRPDRLLLTHIHLDHGGGAGKLCRLYPEMTVTAHPRGIRHLLSPRRLWEGSLQVLGNTASVYGEPIPVPYGNILHEPSDFISIDTPGHATHHLTFLHDGKIRILFAGEVAGVCLDRFGARWTMDGKKGKPYTRPATAPPFRPDIAAGSLKRVMGIDHDLFCPGHYGPVDDGTAVMNMALDQLYLWEETISRAPEGTDPENLVNLLIDVDPVLRPLEGFLPEVAFREKSFMTNSISGFMNARQGKK